MMRADQHALECTGDVRFLCECGVELECIRIVANKWNADFLVCHGCRLRYLFDAAERPESEDEAEAREQNWSVIEDYLDLDILQALSKGEVQPWSAH